MNLYSNIFFWLYGIIVLLWHPLRLAFGDDLAPIRFLSYCAPWLLLGLVCGIGTSLIAKKKYLTAFLSFLFIAVSLPYLPFFLPRREAIPEHSETVKVMTYSVMGRNSDYQAIAAVILSQQPDLFFVQETSFAALSPYLTQLYKGETVYHAPAHGGFIAGRFPLTAQQEAGRIPWVTAETPYGPISLWTLHAAKALWQDTQVQLRQIQGLVQDIAATPGMRIVAGDFNTTDKNIPYKLMRLHLRDAHREAGWGFGFTFPTRARRMGSLLPFVRIDYIFYSEDFYALRTRTLQESGGSDHLPVVADLAILQLP